MVVLFFLLVVGLECEVVEGVCVLGGGYDRGWRRFVVENGDGRDGFV